MLLSRVPIPKEGQAKLTLYWFDLFFKVNDVTMHYTEFTTLSEKMLKWYIETTALTSDGGLIKGVGAQSVSSCFIQIISLFKITEEREKSSLDKCCTWCFKKKFLECTILWGGAPPAHLPFLPECIYDPSFLHFRELLSLPPQCQEWLAAIFFWFKRVEITWQGFFSCYLASK